MTQRQKVLSLLAGGVVTIGVLTLDLGGANAQDRATVVTATQALDALQMTPAGKDKRAELDETCAAALLAFDTGKATHFATGTPTADQLKALGLASDTACQAIQDYRDTLAEAATSQAAVEQAYLCKHLARGCPGGGP